MSIIRKYAAATAATGNAKPGLWSQSSNGMMRVGREGAGYATVQPGVQDRVAGVRYNKGSGYSFNGMKDQAALDSAFKQQQRRLAAIKGGFSGNAAETQRFNANYDRHMQALQSAYDQNKQQFAKPNVMYDAGKAVRDNVANAGNAVYNRAVNGVYNAAEGLGRAGEAVQTGLNRAGNAVYNGAVRAGSHVGNAAARAGNAIGSAASNAWGGIKNFGRGLMGYKQSSVYISDAQAVKAACWVLRNRY